MERTIACTLLLLFLPSVIQAQSELTNQRLFDTDPFLPDHYAERVQQFENEPVEPGRIMFLGDSITEGGNWMGVVGDSTVINRGIGGDVTFGVLKRLGDVVQRRPSKLFIMIGINDIGKDIPDAVIADNCRQIIEEVQAKSANTEIYLQSLLPVNPSHPGFPQHYDKEYHVIHLNQLLREVAAATGSHFVNLFPLFLNAQERLAAEFTTDGLHLNERGYRVWAQYLKENGYL